ncbi:unnamed protein product, partial [Didymodactylos carnosus]
MEASFPAVKGQRAGLVSPIISSSASVQCFSFYYHIIDAYVGDNFEDIAVDELRLSDGECNNTEIIPEIHNSNCSFEQNLCGWTHDPTAQFSWTHQYGETPTYDTGPTTGADNSSAYIFIESSLPQALCDRAGLMSPLILRPTTTSGAQCFSFFYH